MRLSFFWRFIAALALVSIVACAVLLLKFTLSAPLLLVVAILTILTLLYAGWLIFTGTHRRLRHGWMLLLVCIVLLAAEIGLLFARVEHRGLLITALLLGALYLLLVHNLRRYYWQQKRRLGETTNATSDFSHPVLIINPKSGDGRAIKAGIDTLARDRGIQVIVTKKEDNIEGLAQRAVERGADVVGVSGGDGTLGAVAKVAIKHKLPLVVLPGGTRCHFARDIGLDPERIVDALEGFSGVARQVDVGVIGERIFLNNASFGIYADIVDHEEYREHKLATSRRVLQELLDGRRKAYDLSFKDGAGIRHNKAVQLFVGVNPYKTLKLLELGRRDSLDTGKLQVTAITELNDATVRQLMGTLTSRHDSEAALSENILQWTTDEFKLDTTTDTIVAGVDGEREQYDTPIKIGIVPKALTIMVPAEGIRSRPVNAFSTATFKQLWQVAVGK
jgi:diacylglycerol kinase family enzyme